MSQATAVREHLPGAEPRSRWWEQQCTEQMPPQSPVQTTEQWGSPGCWGHTTQCPLHSWLLGVRGSHSPDLGQWRELHVGTQCVTSGVLWGHSSNRGLLFLFLKIFHQKPLNYVFMGLSIAKVANSNAYRGQVFYSFDTDTFCILNTQEYSPLPKKYALYHFFY